MTKRINMVHPEVTIRTIERMVRPGERSRFINQAVQHYVSHRSAEALRARLEQTAVRDRDLDSEIAADWSAVDKEAWQQLDTEYPRRGEIYLTALDPTVGREIRKTRPALVVQNDLSNRLSGVTIGHQIS